MRPIYTNSKSMVYHLEYYRKLSFPRPQGNSLG